MKKAIHNLVNSPTYKAWSNMKTRCSNKKVRDYKNYGGRGIKVCDEWFTFDGFLKDMGVKPERYSIERKDNNGNYCKENCIWIPRKEQNKNKRNIHYIEYKGKSQSLIDWARELGLNQSTLAMRIGTYKWSTERALTTRVIKNI